VFDRKTITRIILLFIGALIAATALSFLTFSVRAPGFHARIAENITTLSARSQFYPSVLFGRNFSRLDNYTDALMTQLSMDNPARTIAQQALQPLMVVAFFDEVRELPNQVQSLEARYYQGIEPTYEYGRYWHGYRTPLRILGSIFSYQQLRVVNYLCLSVLFAIAGHSIYQLFDEVVLFFYAVSLFAASIYLVPLSLQFLSVFYILFVSNIALCITLLRKGEDAPILEIVALSAMATAFFDLLTAPLIIVGFLAVIYGMWLYRTQERDEGIIARSLAGIYGLWFFVYGAFWAAKSLIASLFGVSGVGSSMANQVVKFITDASVTDWLNAIPYNVATFMGASSLDANVRDVYYWLYVVGFFVFVALSVIVWLIFLEKKQGKLDLAVAKPYLPMLGIAISPFIWWQLMGWHSANHPFVYREIAVFIFGLAMFYRLVYEQVHVETH